MPQHNQHSLIHVLLFWTTILSIIQIVFIAFFFTNGHHSMSQNTSAVEPERIMQPPRVNNTPSSPPERGLGKMLTFEARIGENNITWEARNQDPDLVSQTGAFLTIMKDGYYFLNLQVTLSQNNNKELTVSLRSKTEVILQGWIKRDTKSTGLLGKVKLLPAGSTLWVSIDSTEAQTVDDDDSVTHLDIIYMHNNL